MRLILVAVMLAGCSWPEIKPDGEGCTYYGVLEAQRNPYRCPTGPDGLPVVLILKTRDVLDICQEHWGCVKNNTAFAIDDIEVIRHEQCHCILGPLHNRY